MIDIYLQEKTIVAGDTLSGKLIWRSDHNKMPRNATISIGWHTEGRGTPERQIVHELPLDSNQLSSSQGLSIPFSLNVPYNGPITYNGNLIRVIWELDVLIKMPGLLGVGEKKKLPFQVIPRSP